MRPTLRLVIGSLCVFVVIVVATTTLAITYTVALETVRDIGKQYTTSLALNARDKLFQYFDEPTRQMEALRDIFKSGDPDFNLPSALPDQTLDRPKIRIIDLLYSQSRAFNHDYTQYGIIFDDGSGCSVFSVLNDSYIHGLCKFAHLWPNNGNMSVLLRDWHKGNGTASPIVFPDYADVDARVRVYDTVQLLVGPTQPLGLWFPAVITYLGSEYRYFFPGGVPLFNSTGSFLGLLAASIDISQISTFLTELRGTPNTEAFAVQPDGFLVGSSHSQPFYTLERVNANTPVGAGCATTADVRVPGNFETGTTMGCRSSAADFAAYPPLQAAAGEAGFLAAASTQVKILSVDGSTYFVASAPVPNRFRYFGINVILSMPEADVLGDIVAGRNVAIGVTAGVAVVAAIVAFALVYVLLQPLADVSKRMLDTAKLRETEDAKDYSMLAEIQDLQLAYTDMNTAIRSFTRYVPRDVVKDLMKTGQLCTIQMTPQLCSMLFVDIAGFTTICERVPPNVLSELVSGYFDRASRIVMEHDGMIDKFIGDCIMAVWGAPFAVANQEVKATLAGVLLNRETMVEPLSRQWDEAGELLRVRVGVSTGEVLAGNMGSAERMNYTVIGDPVNLAARLESMNKQFDTRVMVSEMTAEGLGELFVLRLLMPIAVVGKDQPVKVYEVLGLAAVMTTDDAARLDSVDSAAVLEDGSQSDSLSQHSSVPSLVLNASNGPNVVSSPTMGGSRLGVSTLGGSGALGGSSALMGSAQMSGSLRYRRSKHSSANMVRNAVRKTAPTETPVTCSPEMAAFAAKHTKAVAAYMRKDFAEAVELTGQLLSAKDVHAERSVQLVRELSERYLREGAPEGFDGVYRALEK